LPRSGRTSIAEVLDHGPEGEGIKAPLHFDEKILPDLDANAGRRPRSAAGNNFQKTMAGWLPIIEPAVPEIKTAPLDVFLPAIRCRTPSACRLLVDDATPIGDSFLGRHSQPPDCENYPPSKGLTQKQPLEKMSSSDAYTMIVMNHPEYQEKFENENLLDGREYISHNELNPFLHISLHEMAEDQVI